MTVDPTALCGVWRLERRVADRGTGLVGRVDGRLHIQRAGDELRWGERGEFRWAHVPGRDRDFPSVWRTTPIWRELRLQQRPEGWWMTFQDGSLFHPWSPGSVVEHLCGEDVYSGILDVDGSAGRMRTLWDVRGPAKSQRLVTRLRRTAES